MNSSDSHNALYVERDITSYYQDNSLWDRIAGTNGYDEMEGIFPGCTFDMSRGITTHGDGAGDYAGTNKILILGCNRFYNVGDNNNYINYNHIVCCPLTHFGGARYNSLDADNNESMRGGYNSSEINTITIGSIAVSGNIDGTINEQLYAEFGSHLKTHQESISNSVDTSKPNRRHKSDDLGAVTSFINTNVQAILMSEIEVFGSIIWNSSGFDGGTVKGQFPAFLYNSKNINVGRVSYFGLRDIATYTCYVIAHSYGRTTITSASSKNPCRPRFILA